MKTFKEFLSELYNINLDNSDTDNSIHASIHRNGLDFGDMSEIYTPYTNQVPNETLELHKHLTNHYRLDSPNSTMNHTERNHFSKHAWEYTGDTSNEINSHLWHKHQNPNYGYIPLNHLESIRSLDRGLNSFRSPGSFNVWSSTRHDPREIMNSKGVVHHPAYLSTSIHAPIAYERDVNQKERSNEPLNILKIHVPQGHHGVYLGQQHSQEPNEHEFMLPRGLNLKYLKTQLIQHKGMYDGYPKRKAVHHMEIIQ